MTKSEEAVGYMISVWDEIDHNWREKPDHVEKKFMEAENEARKARHLFYKNQRT